jgi:hypothetical protein
MTKYIFRSQFNAKRSSRVGISIIKSIKEILHPSILKNFINILYVHNTTTDFEPNDDIFSLD